MVATVTDIKLRGLPRRLVAEGVVDEAALQKATEEAKKARASLVSYLVDKQLAEPSDVALAACHEFGVPIMDLGSLELDLDVVRLVDLSLVEKHQALPLFKRGRKLYLGLSDPTNLQAVDEIKFQTGLAVEAVVVEDDKLRVQLAKALEAADTTFTAFDDDDFDLDNLDVSAGDEPVGEDITRADVEDAPVVRFVNKVLLDAIKKGASDIHFEPYEHQFRVRTRMDGVLKELARPPVALAGKVAARIKVMARLDIAERRIPQDGRIKMRLSKKRSIDFRVAPAPPCTGKKWCCESSIRATPSWASMPWATRKSKKYPTSKPWRDLTG